MKYVKRGNSVGVLLDSDEIATAVRAYLVAHGVYAGPVTTVRWETSDDHTTECCVIVDRSTSRLIDSDGNLVTMSMVTL